MQYTIVSGVKHKIWWGIDLFWFDGDDDNKVKYNYSDVFNDKRSHLTSEVPFTNIVKFDPSTDK